MFQKMLQGGESQDKYFMLNLFTGNVANLGTANLNAEYQLFEKINFTFSNGYENMLNSSELVIGSGYRFSDIDCQLHDITAKSFPFWSNGINLTKVDGYALGTEILE